MLILASFFPMSDLQDNKIDIIGVCMLFLFILVFHAQCCQLLPMASVVGNTTCTENTAFLT